MIQAGPQRDISPDILKEILNALRSLKFGVVEIVVHNGQVTEIRQTRRQRFETPKDA